MHPFLNFGRHFIYCPLSPLSVLLFPLEPTNTCLAFTILKVCSKYSPLTCPCMYGGECSLYRRKRHLSTVYGECAGAEGYLVNVCDKSASQAHETQLLKHSWEQWDQSHGSLGKKPVVSQSSLLWKPWEGWHFACFHTEVQMAAKPISVSTWGKGGGLTEQSHGSVPGIRMLRSTDN